MGMARWFLFASCRAAHRGGPGRGSDRLLAQGGTTPARDGHDAWTAPLGRREERARSGGPRLLRAYPPNRRTALSSPPAALPCPGLCRTQGALAWGSVPRWSAPRLG